MWNVLRRIHGLAWILIFSALFVLALEPIASAVADARRSNGDLAYSLKAYRLDGVITYMLAKNHFRVLEVTIFGAAAISVAVSWYRSNRRLAAWFCKRCGYDLISASKTEDIVQCPECGARYERR